MTESRLDAASPDFPGVRTSTDAQAFLDDPTVDVVVVSTPPDTHADWAVRCLEVGKHVVVEKPFALTAEEADRVLDAARRAGRAAVVYQNRRFDPDFRTVLDVVRSGSIGEVFHIETFIGGYGHPCNYWHSDEAVSGGAVYDWGSHVIDQLLALHPGPSTTSRRSSTSVGGTTSPTPTTPASPPLHRRGRGVVRPLRPRGGPQAALVRPGARRVALSSTWRRTSVTRRSAIGTLDEDVLAVTDAPPQVLRSPRTGRRRPSRLSLLRRTPSTPSSSTSFAPAGRCRSVPSSRVASSPSWRLLARRPGRAAAGGVDGES